MAEAKEVINTWTGRAPIVMSLAAIALLVIALTTGWERGYKDEGAVAHSWQLLVGLQVPLIVVFLATADWRKPRGVLMLLGLQVLGLILAMAPVRIMNL
jgi:hypothetical protein